jgi:predicted GNAT family N-acyltransferase
MRIRTFQESDEDAVIRIFRSNIPKYFAVEEEAGLRDFLSGCSSDYFVCVVDDEIIGAGGYAANSDGKTISLCWGMIRADHLGTGLGKELTSFRINKAREKVGTLPLVISTSQHTRGFYEKFGFRLTRYQADGFGPGIDICEMRLEPRF